MANPKLITSAGGVAIIDQDALGVHGGLAGYELCIQAEDGGGTWEIQAYGPLDDLDAKGDDEDWTLYKSGLATDGSGNRALEWLTEYHPKWRIKWTGAAGNPTVAVRFLRRPNGMSWGG